LSDFIAIDLGGTKLLGALVDEQGRVEHKIKRPVQGERGGEIADAIHELIQALLEKSDQAGGIGISVPGIAYRNGVVWAPNLAGWDDFPLKDHLQTLGIPAIPLEIESDRSCHLMGEVWKGAASGSEHAIFIAVGTGIGAGILADGHVLRGQNDISGAIGWMALNPEYAAGYKERGCFETHASGYGLAFQARQLGRPEWNTEDIFPALEKGDPAAQKLMNEAIRYWGMACANLVSIFNPGKIIFGGGVFGPAVRYIPIIYEEASRWAQPVSIRQVQFLPSQLGDEAGILGAAWFAYKKWKDGLEKR